MKYQTSLRKFKSSKIWLALMIVVPIFSFSSTAVFAYQSSGSQYAQLNQDLENTINDPNTPGISKNFPTGSAQDIQEKAVEFCGEGDGPLRRACRQGYREGYEGAQIKSDACDSDTYNNEQKERCRSGYDEGQKQRSKDEGSTSPGVGSSGKYQCGEDNKSTGTEAIKTKINFGCREKGNPIFDVMFAIIRFLTYGVGIAVVIAIILAGIKYTTSEGNPETTMAAKNQIQNALLGLLIYLFAFAILNFLIPGGLLA